MMADLWSLSLRPPQQAGVPQTWDYTHVYWGHNYQVIRADESTAHLVGWGADIKVGDYLLLPKRDGETLRYRVRTIEYYLDPEDMWKADVTLDQPGES